MDLYERIMELSRYGYFCSQIIAILVTEAAADENPKLVQAMAGLNGGVGFSGDVCGCMTGGCCMLSYFTGKPDAMSYDSPHHKGALGEFIQWFTDEMELEYQSIDCRDITKGSPAKRVELCPQIIAATCEKIMQILEDRSLI